MIKNTLTSILILTVTIAFSQTNKYFPFPESDAVWRDSTCGVISWEMTGDTVWNNFTYHKLTRSEFVYPLSISQLCEYWDPPSFRTFYAGAIRQDTALRKVYFLPPSSITDTLLYDFNLVVGDTVRTFITFGGELEAVVTSIDSILIGSQYRKIWTVPIEHWPFKIIEGIGSTRGPIEPIAPIGGYTQYEKLICYSQNFQTLYPYYSPSSICEVVTGIPEQSQTDTISISPNPSNGKFFIESPVKGKISVQITDLNGILMFRQNIFDKSYINATALNEGLYILTVKSDASIAFKKLIIVK
jgi:hypothetical protein